MPASWVVVFDCGEAAIASDCTEADAWETVDPLGCKPVAVHPLARCVLKKEPWIKDGMLRCDLAWVHEEEQCLTRP